MCDNMLQAYLAKYPKIEFGTFYLTTRQYREYVQLEKEYIFFNTKYLKRFEDIKVVYVPCGKCIQCLTKRSKNWEIRSVFQLLESQTACCLTLTYDDDNLPICDKTLPLSDDETIDITDDRRGIINYKDVQDFIKRIRKHFGFKKEIKYICSCEYGGSGTLRPHYHLLLFNYCPDDLIFYKKSKKGTLLYKSKFLNDKWSKGFVDVGKADVQSCRYISQYCCKNLLKERKSASSYNKKVLKAKNLVARESLHSSIGLGLKHFKRNYHSIIDSGFIKYGKFCYAIPSYFINKLEIISDRLFQIVKQKSRDYWVNFKWTLKDRKNALIKSEQLLKRLNLFHSDSINLLTT